MQVQSKFRSRKRLDEDVGGCEGSSVRLGARRGQSNPKVFVRGKSLLNNQLF